MMRANRLLYLGNAVVDLALPVPRLPARGGDVLARSSRLVAGGGANVMVAAARQGLAVAYGGAHGTGPMGDLVRIALQEAGIEPLLDPTAELDTGVVVTLVEDSGERTFVTTVGAEATLHRDQLPLPGPGDFVAISGYGLLGNSDAIMPWLSAIPDSTMVFFDPGPLGSQLPAGVLTAALRRSDWFSCNAMEAQALSGIADPIEATRWLAGRTGRRGVLVRTGADGCLLAEHGGEPVVIPAPPVTAIDTSGAGDVHAGVFLAALADGVVAAVAARRANIAAALSVTRLGPDAAPTRAELDAASR